MVKKEEKKRGGKENNIAAIRRERGFIVGGSRGRFTSRNPASGARFALTSGDLLSRPLASGHGVPVPFVSARRMPYLAEVSLAEDRL